MRSSQPADTTFTNQCLPWTTHNYTILPYWDDLYLVNSGFGIFTSISGTAPNRIFNIEWRAQYFPGSGSAGFELRLYEGQTRFDVIYGTVTNANTSATAGVQKNDTAFDQYFCNGAGMPATGAQSYILTPCTSPTPTPTASPSATPTAPDCDTPDSPGYGYTYGAVYGYTYTNRKPKLHTALHIHRGDRDDRSGHNRYWQSHRRWHNGHHAALPVHLVRAKLHRCQHLIQRQSAVRQQ